MQLKFYRPRDRKKLDDSYRRAFELYLQGVTITTLARNRGIKKRTLVGNWNRLGLSPGYGHLAVKKVSKLLRERDLTPYDVAPIVLWALENGLTKEGMLKSWNDSGLAVKRIWKDKFRGRFLKD